MLHLSSFENAHNSKCSCDYRGLVLSQLDAGQSDEAAKTCSSAVQLARKKAPQKLGELMRLYVSITLYCEY